MNILLICPCLSTSDRYGDALGKVGPATEPLGLAYLATSIKQNRKQDYVEIFDAVALNSTEDDIRKQLKKRTWDVVGITMLTPMYIRAKETIRLAKEIYGKDIKIIVGGAHPTIFPTQTLEENPDIDVAVFGEGEFTILELLDAFEKKKTLSKIKGIVYRQKGKIKQTKPREFIKNIDESPIPARELLDMSLYTPAPTYYKRKPSYVMLTSRGCPYRCVYCSKISGRLYRAHSVERIIKEMKILIEDYGAKEIVFRDDTFTINKEHVTNLCNEILRQELHKKIKWSCMTRVNTVTEDLLKLMAKAGCWSIHYGVESGNQRLLDLIQKDITLEQVRSAFKWTRKAGIEIKAFFMVGLPTETQEETLRTIEFAKEIDPDWIQVTITVPYPGTKLFEIAKEEKTIKSFKWENYQTWAGWSDKELVYVTKGREEKELKDFQRRAMREFYLQPKVIFKMLLQLRSRHMLKMYINGYKALVKSKFKK